MSKWVKIDNNRKILAAYIVDTPQKIDKPVNTDLSLQELIGMTWVDEDTVVPGESKESLAIAWRDTELAAVENLTEANLSTYRQQLIDFENSEEFPDIFPALYARTPEPF